MAQHGQHLWGDPGDQIFWQRTPRVNRRTCEPSVLYSQSQLPWGHCWVWGPWPNPYLLQEYTSINVDQSQHWPSQLLSNCNSKKTTYKFDTSWPWVESKTSGTRGHQMQESLPNSDTSINFNHPKSDLTRKNPENAFEFRIVLPSKLCRENKLHFLQPFTNA